MLLLWSTQEAMAWIYESDEMFTEAEGMFQRCAALIQKSTSPHPFIGEARLATQCHLAKIFAETGRDSQAYDILDGLVKTFEGNPQLNYSMLTLSLTFLVRGDLHRRRFRFNLALQDLEKGLK